MWIYKCLLLRSKVNKYKTTVAKFGIIRVEKPQYRAIPLLQGTTKTIDMAIDR